MVEITPPDSTPIAPANADDESTAAAEAARESPDEEPVELEAVAPITGFALHGGEALPGSAIAVEAAHAPGRRPHISLREKSAPQEAEMDMTPMVDVTFLLLIFFMVTASFTMQKSLNIPKPESSEPSAAARSIDEFEQNPDYVVVRVDGLNTYHISAAVFEEEIEAPSEQELLVRLRQARQGDGSGKVPTKLLVIANGNALHEKVVTAIDGGNEIGMEEVQLLTVEDEEG